MNGSELKKLSKSQLIELILSKNEKKKPVIIPQREKEASPHSQSDPKRTTDLNNHQKTGACPRTKKSKISTIIQRPVPAPRTKKSKISTIIQRPVPTPRTKKPKISTKKSYILDEPIPEKEIPKGQKILQPSIILRMLSNGVRNRWRIGVIG